MKAIPEILGGAQKLLPVSFDIQRCFKEHFTHLRMVSSSAPGDDTSDYREMSSPKYFWLIFK